MVISDLFIDDIKQGDSFNKFNLEIVNKDPNLFQSNLKYTEQIKFHTFNTIISSYPVKSTFEDFYLNSNFLKKSLTMSKCSQQNRELTSNF